MVEIAGHPTKMHFIVNTLGYSRRFHFWCTDSQDAEHTYEGLILSFEYFGGVTREVLVDNMKSAVLKPSNQGQPHFPGLSGQDRQRAFPRSGELLWVHAARLSPLSGAHQRQG